ncbi:hypothetical protein MT325_m720R [Paramecium bursaria chlorella virus MT325]|uniref:Uncharacterized protein m720R n=1 Tax=Paramecium bursaria Chlorella virus MT325 TaxID=346932 RepID=A7IVA0_PBCVM|nr:hypothetical protein MT325_m720R [Paramecium bursaria chlorella virus MT325]
MNDYRNGFVLCLSICTGSHHSNNDSPCNRCTIKTHYDPHLIHVFKIRNKNSRISLCKNAVAKQHTKCDKDADKGRDKHRVGNRVQPCERFEFLVEEMPEDNVSVQEHCRQVHHQ